jgi:hypothetical protein
MRRNTSVALATQALRSQRKRCATSLTTSNEDIASQPPCALWVSARRGHLLRWRSSTMTRNACVAMHLPPPSQKRDTS